MSFLTRLPRAAPALKRAYATVADASGVKVAGVEHGSPAATSSVTVVVKAGSRYETKPGAAHVLKSFAFKVGQLCGQDQGRELIDIVNRVGICVKDS
jgi:ubiquinol-cytochrome c reductase core subunit 2